MRCPAIFFQKLDFFPGPFLFIQQIHQGFQVERIGLFGPGKRKKTVNHLFRYRVPRCFFSFPAALCCSRSSGAGRPSPDLRLWLLEVSQVIPRCQHPAGSHARLPHQGIGIGFQLPEKFFAPCPLGPPEQPGQNLAHTRASIPGHDCHQGFDLGIIRGKAMGGLDHTNFLMGVQIVFNRQQGPEHGFGVMEPGTCLTGQFAHQSGHGMGTLISHVGDDEIRQGFGVLKPLDLGQHGQTVHQLLPQGEHTHHLGPWPIRYIHLRYFFPHPFFTAVFTLKQGIGPVIETAGLFSAPIAILANNLPGPHFFYIFKAQLPFGGPLFQTLRDLWGCPFFRHYASPNMKSISSSASCLMEALSL